MNHSPRIAQLIDRHPYHSRQTQSDVAIIGGGIAGVMTAYHILKHTTKSVAIYEARQIARGATGHNAGQVAPYFEKDWDDIVQEYGLEMASDAQQSVLMARDLLVDIIDYTNCVVPFHSQLGYAGCSTDEQLEHHLHKKLLREQGKSSFDAIFVLDTHPKLKQWSQQYPGIFEPMAAEHICQHLETDSDQFIGLLVCRKAVINSAALCEYLIQWMIDQYSKRFVVHEHTPIGHIDLYRDQVTITSSQGGTYVAEDLVLCTNGFEHFEITNHNGTAIDKWFHDSIYGNIGYMSAYYDSDTSYRPVAISYFMSPDKMISNTGYDVYFYFTRRPYLLNNQSYTLVSVGGPETLLKEPMYDHTADHPQRAHDQNMSFLTSYYKHIPDDRCEIFRRHGLMGYTKTGLRMIGPHPHSSRLWFNIGCNGVGILTSIYGGYKIGRMMGGEQFEPSVFDVTYSIT